MFCLICMDKPGHIEVRLENRTAHINYVLASPQVKIAGPFVAEDGETRLALCWCWMLRAARRRKIGRQRPLRLGRPFRPVEIHPWKHLLGGLPTGRAVAAQPKMRDSWLSISNRNRIWGWQTSSNAGARADIGTAFAIFGQ